LEPLGVKNRQSSIINRQSSMPSSRIASIFASRRPALMPFITGGFPSLEATRRLLPALEQAGASIIEIGFPFSDPIADGPVIAQSMHRALQAGVTPRHIFDLVAELRPRTQLGLIAMVSDSIVTRYRKGPEDFVRDAAAAGFDGLIVPDIDLDAAIPLAGLAQLHNLSFTLLIAPTSTEERIARIVSLCSGFVYVLARVGVTGERQQLDVASLEKRLALIRRHTALPLAVGFGITTPEQVAAVARVADAAIVGSAIVRRLEQEDTDAAIASAATLVRELAAALHRQPA
jgi:tryptophan synthase alpha chain